MHLKHKIAESRGDRCLLIFFYIFITLFSLMCLYPLVLAFSVSFSSERAIAFNGYSIIPQEFTLDTYTYLLSQKMKTIMHAYGMTILVTVVGTFWSLIVTLMYAFAISMRDFRHADKFAFFAYFTMLFSGGMLPWYILCTRYYHLSNTFLGLFLPYTMNVFNMFLMRNYLRTIPDAIYESAKIDGAGYGRIFFRITLPLSKAGMATVGLFYGISYWNDFYLPLMLASTDDSLHTLQYILYRMMSSLTFLITNSGSTSALQISPPMETASMAMCILAIGPIVLLYPFVQKYFVDGIIVGAVKG